jgi:hypothetical protein
MQYVCTYLSNFQRRRSLQQSLLLGRAGIFLTLFTSTLTYSYCLPDSNDEQNKENDKLNKYLIEYSPWNGKELYEGLQSVKIRLTSIENRKPIPIIDEVLKYISKIFVASVPGL